jgi:Transcriptional regulators
MAGHNLAVADNLVRISDFRENGGYQSMKDIWTMPDRPSAVFIANNLMTIGALNALSDLEVQVPRDVSVIGFDDLSFAALLNPPLTAIRRPDIEQGASAARLLLGRILDGDESAPQSVTLPVELVVRGSTSAIQQRDGGTSVEE